MTIHTSLYIGGAWRSPASSEVISVVSPTTEQEIGQAPRAGTADVDAAVTAARRALDESGWAQWEPARRAEAMERLADALDRRGE